MRKSEIASMLKTALGLVVKCIEIVTRVVSRDKGSFLCVCNRIVADIKLAIKLLDDI